MSTKKISIVLPVYNVEKYLRKCLDSLCAQTMLEDIEVIAVNDGSKDSSPAILREYEKEHPGLFRIYDIENQGVSHARNFGVSVAEGEFIQFVDSDDYIQPKMCELLYNKAVQDGDDVVVCRYYNVKENAQTGHLSKQIGKSYLVNYDDDFSVKDRKYQLVHISPFPWDKLYRRTLIERYPFPLGIRFEDLSMMYQTMCAAEKIGILRTPLYNYRRTSTTSFLNSFSEQTLDIIPSLTNMIDAMKKQGDFENFREEIEYICVRHVFVRFNTIFDIQTLKEKRGKLDVKKRILTECLGFLDENFPDWRENRYLKYTASANNRAMRKVYADKKKTLRKLRFYEYTPVWMLKLCVKLKRKGKKVIAFLRGGNKGKKIKNKLKEMKKSVKKRISSTPVYKLISPPRDVKYTKMLKKYPVSENEVLFLSKHGEDVAGNIFYMLKAMQQEKYSRFQIYLALTEETMEEWVPKLKKYGITRVQIIVFNSKEYLKRLVTAKYLITDMTFAAYYVKREGQVYLNTWHGTPMKMMGRKVPNREYALGNVQRNFFLADYLLYQNDFSKDIFLDDYMLREIYDGEVLLPGYPRNSAFFNTDRGEKLRAQLGLKKKQVIVYMPTWRGLVTQKKNKEQIEIISEYLQQIDDGLTEGQIMYVKLHPYVKQGVDYQRYRRVVPFPKEYETYDFLNVADVLVTDYSSIMFDYAASKKKMVLFTYDREEYLAERGMYIDMNQLELPIADTVEELLACINDSAPALYPKFWEQFCRYDSATNADDVCEYVFLNREPAFKTEKVQHNGKKNILMLSKGLPKGRRAARRVDALNQYNLEHYNYYYCMKADSIRKSGKALAGLSDDFFYMPLVFDVNYTLHARIACFLAFCMNLGGKWVEEGIQELAQIECRKYFGDVHFDAVVNVNSRDRIMHHVCKEQKGVKIYNWAGFDGEQYQKSRKYRKLVNYILAHMDGYEYMIVNAEMKQIWEKRKDRPELKLILAENENFRLEQVMEEIVG